MPLLEVENLQVSYGVIEAIKDLSLFVEKGEIITLIGANGAGKSTLLKTLSGLLKPQKGRMIYKPDLTPIDLHPLKPHEIIGIGIAQSPEGRQIFLNLTVRENLELGAYTRGQEKHWKHDLEKVFGLFPRLFERQRQNSGTLSGGEQQMLAIGRALLADPKLLLLDEPSLGIAPILVDQIFKSLVEINSLGVTLLLVEQDAKLALEISQRGYVIETGKKVLEGRSKDLLKNPDLKKAYFGEW